MLRTWFALLTALLLGATLTAPVAAAGEGAFDAGGSTFSGSLETLSLALGDLDTDSEDAGHGSLDYPTVGYAQAAPEAILSEAVPIRFAELPPARASPLYL